MRFASRRRRAPGAAAAIALGALPKPIAALLRTVQNDLFDVGADLCTPVVDNPEFPPLRVTDAQVEPAVRERSGDLGGLRGKVLVKARVALVQLALSHIPPRADPDALIVPDHL